MNSALSSALMHSLWQCAVIAATLALLLVLVRAAKARYVLACAALAAMPFAFVITFWLGLSKAPPEAPLDTGTRFLASAAILATETFERFPFEPSNRWNLVSLWVAGVLAVGLYRSVGWISAQRLRRRGACAAPQEWQSRLNELSRLIRLSRPVRLLESTLVDGPLMIGALRPVIIVPLGLLAGMPAQQVEAILLHELAHIARYDYFVNLLQAAVEALLFYHPAAWWVSRVTRREREMCCDDLVVAATSDAVTYAKALAALEQYRSAGFALAASSAPLTLRIHRLLKKRTVNEGSVTAAVVFVMLASAAGTLAFPNPEPAPQVPQPPKQEIPAANPTPAPVPTPSPVPRAKAVPSQTLTQTREQEASDAYARWANQEVVWIITPEERAAFGRLQTDDDRQRFIEQFWLRRDPTPDTEVNEFKEEHYRRIAWANDRFAAGVPGWKTDRGMIYVKFGPADDVNPVPATETHPPYEKWTYGYLEGLERSITMEFVDDKSDGNYRLARLPEASFELVRIPGEVRIRLYQQMNVSDVLRRYVTIRLRPTK